MGLPGALLGHAQFLAHERIERGLAVLEDAVGGQARGFLGEALGLVDEHELGALLLGVHLQLLALDLDLAVEGLAAAEDADPLAESHADGARKQPGDAGEGDELASRVGAGDAHNEAEVRDKAIIRAEDGGAEGVPRGAAVTPLDLCDVDALAGLTAELLEEARV